MAAGKSCPSCGNTVAELLKIEGGMRQRLRESSPGAGGVPEEVCSNCYRDLTATISRGAQLRAKQHAKEQQRMALWRNRVTLLRQARTHMEKKAYSEAAVLYEKYLRVLEIIYDCKPGELAPEFFNNKARAKENTVIATVYWDLLRIYDSSQRYGERQKKVAEKLLQFGKFTPVFPKIVRQAEDFAKTAKNSAVIKQFIKQSGKKMGGCFIATAAFENEDAPEVVYLRGFRDSVLSKSVLGRNFIEFYYLTSPPVAEFLRRYRASRFVTRWALKRAVGALSRWFY